MKNFLLKSAILLSLLSPVAMATIFNESNVSSNTPSESGSYVSLFERNESSAWLVETYEENDGISLEYMMKISNIGRQNGSLMVDKGRLATSNLTELLMLSSEETVSFAGGSIAPESGSWVLYDVKNCQLSSCETVRTYRIFLNKNGYPNSIYGQLPVEEIETPKCEVGTGSSLAFNEGEIYRHLGCGEFVKYDYLFVKDESFESSSKWEKDVQSKGIISSSVIDEYSYLLHSEGIDANPYLSIATYDINLNFNGISSKFYIDDNLSKCQQVYLGDKWGIACVKSSGEKTSFVVWSSDENGKWSEVYEREHETPVSDFAVSYSNDHIFSFEQSSENLIIVNQDSDGNVFTTREIDSSGISAKTISNNQYVLMLNEYIDEWDNSRYKLVMFDALTTDQKPYFKKRITATIPTLFDFNAKIEVEDENTLPKNLTVEASIKPTWLELDGETLELKGTPLNSEVGSWPVTIVATDSAGQMEELVDGVSVFLQSAQVKIFEINLFERLGIDEPFPFYDLTQQLSPIQILEDEKFEAQLTVDYRDQGDVELVFESLPSWLTYNKESMILSGTPEQSDVGESDEITVEIVDIYNADEDRYPLIKMKLDVIEVDETFQVLSDGTDSLKVGETYQYTLAVDDEESSITDFTITPGILPSWISFNSETTSFSGTPSENDIGSHGVQVILQDEVGHTVIHNFTVTVMKSDEKKSGGSMSLGMIVILMMVLFRRFSFRI